MCSSCLKESCKITTKKVEENCLKGYKESHCTYFNSSSMIKIKVVFQKNNNVYTYAHIQTGGGEIKQTAKFQCHLVTNLVSIQVRFSCAICIISTIISKGPCFSSYQLYKGVISSISLITGLLKAQKVAKSRKKYATRIHIYHMVSSSGKG